MGKIVKHCVACEESFAQKFVFCPNCGGALKAFEMNPVQEEAKVAADRPTEAAKVYETPKVSQPDNNNFAIPAPPPPPPATRIYGNSPKIEPAIVPVVTAFSANGNSSNGTTANDIQPSVEKVVSDQPTAKTKVAEIFDTQNSPLKNSTTVVTKPPAATVAAGANGNGNGGQYQTTNHAYQPTNSTQNNYADDGFHVTVIEEKNVGQRNMLLLGSMFLMMSLVVGGVVYSLFNKDLLIGAIDAGSPLYITPIEDVPMPIEEQPKPKIEKDSGGGGGGGKENPDPITKGALPTQVEKPANPLLMVTKMTNPDFVVKNETQGNIKREPTNEQVGLPSGLTSDRLSSGGGNGGGFGNGRGAGAGNGRGTGEGNGIGSGSGNGNGNGNGNGTGDGTGSRTPPPPPPAVAVGPTTGVVITAKPRAPYTDAARQNQFTGTVTLRVTFLSSGQIGSISPISGQPYGLTEQAIAAARQIRFEPAKKNGVPQTVTKQVQYSFTLY